MVPSLCLCLLLSLYCAPPCVCDPARCLLSACRPSVSEDDLKSLFSSNGGVVKGFKFFQ